MKYNILVLPGEESQFCTFGLQTLWATDEIHVVAAWRSHNFVSLVYKHFGQW